MSQTSSEFVPLGIAVLTVSDTRNAENDTSGDLLVQRLENAGHQLIARELLPDDRYQLRATVSRWITDPAIEVVLVTGGTGLPIGMSRRRPWRRCSTSRSRALVNCSARYHWKISAPQQSSRGRWVGWPIRR